MNFEDRIKILEAIFEEEKKGQNIEPLLMTDHIKKNHGINTITESNLKEMVQEGYLTEYYRLTPLSITILQQKKFEENQEKFNNNIKKTNEILQKFTEETEKFNSETRKFNLETKKLTEGMLVISISLVIYYTVPSILNLISHFTKININKDIIIILWCFLTIWLIYKNLKNL